MYIFVCVFCVLRHLRALHRKAAGFSRSNLLGFRQKKTRTENNPAEVFLRLLLLHILLETFLTYHMLKVL